MRARLKFSVGQRPELAREKRIVSVKSLCYRCFALFWCSQNGYTDERGHMRQVSLREFRTRGAKALTSVPRGETILLAGQQGPAYFLIPVSGDVITEDRELRRAMAKASLRKNWQLAETAGSDLDQEEIDREISRVRVARQRRKPK